MRKPLVFLAIAALSAGAAQAAPSVYGTVDAGFNYTRANGESMSSVESGQKTDSFVGFKGTEQLGQSLRASYVVEAAFEADSGVSSTGKLFSREASVGLGFQAHSVKIGRTETLANTALKQFDVFGGGNFGTARGVTDTAGDYSDNTIAYSYSGNGLTGGLTHSFGEQSGGGVSGGATNAFQAGYAKGAVSASLTHTVADAGPRTTLVAGGYDFGVVKATAMYQNAKDSSLDHSVLVGLKAPVKGNLVALASIGRVEMADGEKVDVFSLGGEYSLSKRTNLYASYGKLDLVSAKGERVALGMNHRF